MFSVRPSYIFSPRPFEGFEQNLVFKNRFNICQDLILLRVHVMVTFIVCEGDIDIYRAE
jgi:hypothetical protein